MRAKNKKYMRFEKVSKEQFLSDVKNWAKELGWDVNEQALSIAYDELPLPHRATRRSAGYDFYAPFDIHMNAGEPVKIYTGVKWFCDDSLKSDISDFGLFIYPRSSLSNKYGMRLSNTVGIVDADYYGNSQNEGHIMVQVVFDDEYTLKKGERLAQGVIHEVFMTDNDKTDAERDGGFGSTGRL